MICCSLIAQTKEEMIKDMLRVRSKADIIEIRLDYLKNIEETDIKEILEKKPCKLIMTCRKKDEGGKYFGTEEKRIGILSMCMSLGADYIDIEYSSGEKTISQLTKEKQNSKVILSYHNFKEVPSDITGIYNDMKKQKCDIIKIACKANTLEDNLKIFDIIKKAKAEKVDVIGICMGEKGEISRILGPYYGSVISYGYLDKGKESAPGQISCEFLKLVYRVDKINPSWKIYGLVGSPVSKSRGYIIHNLAFKEKNINAVYVNFLVDDLEKFFASFKGTFSGLSITMPHKEEVMKYLDEVNADAKKTGAINTIVDKNGKLIGYNTDEYGAVSAIEEKTTLKGKNVVMAGAGGVAHAIGHGIVKKEGNLTIVNRTREKGEKLAKELNAEFMDPNDIKWESVDIFINATSVGMMPDTENTSLEPKYLKRMKKAVVFDTIYNPLVTKLIHSAEKNNLMAISGIRMFIHQAEKQFELWTGKQAGETMENAVLEYIS